MKITLQISDDLYDLYAEEAEKLAANGAEVTAADIIARQLDRFKGVSAADRILIVNTKVREDLEHWLGSYLNNAEELTEKVRLLAYLSIGGIDIPLTPGQWADLKDRAMRRQITVDTMLKEQVDSTKELLWNKW